VGFFGFVVVVLLAGVFIGFWLCVGFGLDFWGYVFFCMRF